MTRYEPRIPPVLACLILGAWVVAGAAVTAAVVAYFSPARGQECRFAFDCPFVASAASMPAGRMYRVPARRVHYHFAKSAKKSLDTLTDADREAAPDMPLVWPALDDEPIEPVAVPTKEIAPQPLRISTFLPNPAPKEITPWRHSDDGKRAILTVFVLLVAVTAAGLFPPITKRATA